MSSISSPCIKICTMDPSLRICTGCGRTMAEIGGWLRMSEAERSRVTAQLGRRLQAARSTS